MLDDLDATPAADDAPPDLVARATASLARYHQSQRDRGGVPRRRFRPSTATEPCRVITDTEEGTG